jgi:hypothetical protein
MSSLIPSIKNDTGIFLLTTASRPALGPTSLLSSGYRGSYPGVKRPWREAVYSPPCSVEIKNAWNYTSISSIRLHDMVLT